jgi:hypothetical protein
MQRRQRSNRARRVASARHFFRRGNFPRPQNCRRLPLSVALQGQPQRHDAMNPLHLIWVHFSTVLLAAAAGLVAMELAMWIITRRGWAKGNMVVAIGSLVTRTRENALFFGLVLHVIAAIFFATLYLLAMIHFQLTHFPAAFLAGVCFGLIHGMVVTLALVWIVSEQHPLEEFQDAGLAVGVSHIAGHIAYGAAVGVIIGMTLK